MTTYPFQFQQWFSVLKYVTRWTRSTRRRLYLYVMHYRQNPNSVEIYPSNQPGLSTSQYDILFLTMTDNTTSQNTDLFVTHPVYDQINYRVICGNHSSQTPRVTRDYDGDRSQFLPTPSPTLSNHITQHTRRLQPIPDSCWKNKNVETKMDSEGQTVRSRRRRQHGYAQLLWRCTNRSYESQ